MLRRAAILVVIAALSLLIAPLPGEATKPFAPTLDMLTASPPGLSPTHGDVFRRVQVPANHHLPAVEALSVPPDWDIAADAAVNDNDVVAGGQISVDQACNGELETYAFDIVDKPAASGQKAHWHASIVLDVDIQFPVDTLELDFVVTGNAAAGHTITGQLFTDPTVQGNYCAPLDLLITHKGVSSFLCQAVLTNPGAQGWYTWSATYTPGPLPAPHPDVTVSDAVAIGPDVDSEAIYRDNDNSATVSAGDTLLVGPAVAGGTALANFDASDRHVDPNADGIYDPGEAIYRDSDATGTVTACDTLLLGSAAAQGTPLVPFQGGATPERHTEPIFDGLFDPGDGVADFVDNCPTIPNPAVAPGLPQIDTDNDAMGDPCDPCPSNPDCDGDGVRDGSDPCPLAVDCDGDGFRDGIEFHAGTSLTLACSADATPDNEEPDARPTDLNDDRSVTGADLSRIAGDVGRAVPPAPVRKDIAPDLVGDNAITGADLSRVAGVIGTSC